MKDLVIEFQWAVIVFLLLTNAMQTSALISLAWRQSSVRETIAYYYNRWKENRRMP